MRGKFEPLFLPLLLVVLGGVMAWADEKKTDLLPGDFISAPVANDHSRAASLHFAQALSSKGEFRLKPGEKLTLTVAPMAAEGQRALRFQARVNGDSGWQNLLKVSIAGKALKGGVLNRAMGFSSRSWQNQSMFAGESYNVFFTRDYGIIDKDILDKEQRKECTWLVLDCGDSASGELEFHNIGEQTVLLRNITVGVLPAEPSAPLPQALQMKLVDAQLLAKELTLVQGEEAVLPFEVKAPRPGLLPVIRFRSRISYKEVEGWGNYLNIRLNGEPLTEQDKYAESRLLNRSSSFASSNWPSQALAVGNNYLVFFTNDWDKVHPQWVADENQRRENTWFVLRLDDALAYNATNKLTFKNAMQLADFPWPIQVAHLEFGWYNASATPDQHQKMPQFKAALSRKIADGNLELSANGAVRLSLEGCPALLLESSFSYPHAGKEWHGFHADDQRKYTQPWQPQISPDGFAVQSAGREYRVRREIHLRLDGLEFHDCYENLQQAPVGILVRNLLFFEDAPKELRFGGLETNPRFAVSNMNSPSNPTVFARWAQGGLGVMLVDTVSRMQMTSGGGADCIHFGTEKLALDPLAKRTLVWRVRWQKDGDYWSFINACRRDIGANYTILGYCQFSGLTYQRPEPDCRFVPWFRESLGPKRPAYVISAPWFCYYDGALYTVEKWLEVYRKAQASFNQVNDWGGRLLPALEPSIQPIPKKIVMTDYPAHANRYPTDSLIVQANGKYRFTKQWTVGRPVINYRSYLLRGTQYFQKIFQGIQEALDAGAGGIYFDIFTANSSTYDRMDGATGEIDPNTYELKRRYALCGILEEEAKRFLVEYIRSRGGVVLCNGFPAWDSLTSTPIFSFYECNDLDFATMSRGHLATPVGLSLGWVKSEKKTGRDLIRAIHGRLSYGGLFFPYITELNEGWEAAEILNLMFPITIEELHAGWIQGRERTIAAVPRVYAVTSVQEPSVAIFSAEGTREKNVPRPIATGSAHWQVDFTTLPSGSIAVIINR
ncbi:MAG: hypothetical protein IJJ33_18990 [Victivallales bacterium]|nr:hypothetical protein [Victivallales bacterium]